MGRYSTTSPDHVGNGGHNRYRVGLNCDEVLFLVHLHDLLDFVLDLPGFHDYYYFARLERFRGRLLGYCCRLFAPTVRLLAVVVGFGDGKLAEFHPG